VHQAHQDLPDHQGLLDFRGRVAKLVCQDQRVHRVAQEMPVLQDKLALRVPKELKEIQAVQEQLGNPDQLDHKDLKDQRDRRVQPEHLDSQVSRDNRVIMVLKAILDRPVVWVHKEPLDLQDNKAQVVHQARQGALGLWARLAAKEYLETTARLVHQDRQANLVRPGYQAPQALQALLDHREILAPLERQVELDPPVLKVLLDSLVQQAV
jgi:hypothetical protein